MARDETSRLVLEYTLRLQRASPSLYQVTQEMLPFTGSCFGNPSSAHALGRTCKVAVDKARARLAALLGCTSDEVVFVASGSEADNHAIVAAVSAKRLSRHFGRGE